MKVKVAGDEAGCYRSDRDAIVKAAQWVMFGVELRTIAIGLITYREEGMFNRKCRK